MICRKCYVRFPAIRVAFQELRDSRSWCDSNLWANRRVYHREPQTAGRRSAATPTSSDRKRSQSRGVAVVILFGAKFGDGFLCIYVYKIKSFHQFMYTSTSQGFIYCVTRPRINWWRLLILWQQFSGNLLSLISSCTYDISFLYGIVWTKILGFEAVDCGTVINMCLLWYFKLISLHCAY